MKVVCKKAVDRDELINALGDLISRKQDLDEQFEGIEEYFGSITDSTVYNAAYMTFDKYCEMFCLAFGIDGDDLSWFIYEDELGEAGKSYVVNGKTFTIEGGESFVDYLIEKSEFASKSKTK